MHDFKKFPELTNSQMEIYYFESPHKQITQDFTAKCVKVHDGDTLTVQWSERLFLFPVRFIDIAAPELGTEGGLESQLWLQEQALGRELDIRINPDNRVDKWGRLLGRVYCGGLNLGQLSVINGKSVAWENLHEGEILDSIRLPKEWA